MERKQDIIGIAVVAMILLTSAVAEAVVNQSPISNTNSATLSYTVYTHKVQKVAWWDLKDDSGTGADEYSNERIRVEVSGIKNLAFSHPEEEAADVSYGFTGQPEEDGIFYVTLANQRTIGYWTLWGMGKGSFAGSNYTVKVYDDDDNSILVSMNGTISDPSAYQAPATQVQQSGGLVSPQQAPQGIPFAALIMQMAFFVIIMGGAFLVAKKVLGKK